MTPRVQDKLKGIAETAIAKSFDVAILGMSGPLDAAASGEAADRSTGKGVREKALQAAVAVSGAVGGFAGLAGLAPDISFTTLTIMREIARIAREEGEDLSDPDSRRACLEVFALRAFPNIGEGRESELGYFSARTVLRGRPVVMLISEVASHYGLALGHKISLQLMPVAGALCGASLNAAFLAIIRRWHGRTSPSVVWSVSTVRQCGIQQSLCVIWRARRTPDFQNAVRTLKKGLSFGKKPPFCLLPVGGD